MLSNCPWHHTPSIDSHCNQNLIGLLESIVKPRKLLHSEPSYGIRKIVRELDWFQLDCVAPNRQIQVYVSWMIKIFYKPWISTWISWVKIIFGLANVIPDSTNNLWSFMSFPSLLLEFLNVKSVRTMKWADRSLQLCWLLPWTKLKEIDFEVQEAKSYNSSQILRCSAISFEPMMFF